jgi:superfamily II DNA helicase RecQ
LKNWRSEKERESQLPAYIIFHNTHLVSIAKFKPSNLEDLEHVSGIGKSKIEKFGIEILKFWKMLHSFFNNGLN